MDISFYNVYLNAALFGESQEMVYTPNGSNGLIQIQVVTKNGQETFNAQEYPDRWYYEVKNMTRLLLNENRSAIRQQMDIMLDVVEIIESIRKSRDYFLQ